MSNTDAFANNCYNLLSRYKFKRYYIDSSSALQQQNRWLTYTQDFNINNKIEEQLTILSIPETNANAIKVKGKNIIELEKFSADYYYSNYHNYKSFEKNNDKANQVDEKQDTNLLAFAGPEQIVYEGSKVFLEGITFPINQKLIWKQIGGPKVDLKYECKEDEITKIKNPFFKAPYITLDFDNNVNDDIKHINNDNKIKPYVKLTFELTAKDPTETLSSLPSTVNIIVKMVQRALIFQGGGALGAYEAGVFKALCEHIIEEDNEIKEKKNRPL